MECYSNPLVISIIIGFIEVAKTAGFPKKYAPLLSLFIGIVISIFYDTSIDVKERILKGIIAGLTSSGLFSGYKSLTRK
ncbi:hypothetical protein SAMN05661008_01307 [Alkalithermobacter thermoalcaliphilus JW-YL-7 = DSM 7308]|uniref:Holin n=1 Tax=Alkalithermobacter thermoalcaliphilus JW-YL-7 = DSM 7308 TaxID=1121328 RepID=A0A150FR83_CLOPD|nr:hypothetical protein JWYL7_1177 [[Clostridium] paradoxum JW-YL-7 = DSM 7308]SHL01730.1 hypothetical protein SAMN05661008_01307 [[Clostridium] paradoxum JW-YL-7 = DSM 7308]